jgi:PAS domain-containing protein
LKPIDPVQLLDSRALFQRAGHFESGSIVDCATDLANVAVHKVLGRNSAGWWECNLTDNALTWTAGVYDIFGLPLAAPVTRDEAVGFYREDSRAVMERLRSYAIGHRSGFILDARIRPATGPRERWMRLVGASVCQDGHVVSLHGLKLII